MELGWETVQECRGSRRVGPQELGSELRGFRESEYQEPGSGFRGFQELGCQELASEVESQESAWEAKEWARAHPEPCCPARPPGGEGLEWDGALVC